MPSEASALLPPVAWECVNCAHTNEGTEPGPCSGCGAVDPIRYMIWKRQGRLYLAPTAINTRVDRSLQCLLSADTDERPTLAAPHRADVVALERRGGQGGTYGGVLSPGTRRRIEGEKKTKIKLVVALDGSRRGKYMQQPTKNTRTRWGRDRIQSATVGERSGGVHSIVLGQSSWEGGVE